MTNKQVTDTMDKNLRNTYEGLPNLMYVHSLSNFVISLIVNIPRLVRFSGYETREDDFEGMQNFSHWKRAMGDGFDLRSVPYCCFFYIFGLSC
jgi:hypothetical protein